ncbi:MAG: Rrf2 family transcriptional regulator [Phycisphaerae bacterium]|nr:Rrf2 family transcriptional regulator [Phycisphaerae bacterium]
MATVSQKCQYALRAVLELSRRYGSGPTSVAAIAEAQAIPQRFLELIIGELRQAGVVTSKRGARGGYILLHEPGELSVSAVMKAVDSDYEPVDCEPCGGKRDCPLAGHCSFVNLWRRAGSVIHEVYDQTSFQDLLEEQSGLEGMSVADYCI